MNDLTCAEIADLLPAYVLNAIDGDERCALLEHLAECRLHDAELQIERQAALRLVEAVPEEAPPARLRSSLLDAFDREVAGTTTQTEPVPVSLPERRMPVRQVLRAPAFAYSIAAGLLILAVALGAWGVSRGSDAGEGGVRLAAARGNAMRLDVTYLPDRNLAVLNFDMPAAPSGHTYQAWSIVDGKPVSLGVMSQNSGTVTFAADLDKASGVAISVEPTGGSEQPTTTPVLVSNF